MGDLEAVADAVTGGVVGRAVEPKAGEGDGHTHETSCLNCGAALTGPFCVQCGQHAALPLIRDLRRKGVTEATFSRSKEKFSSNLPWMQEAYRKARANPDLILYKVKSNSYKWSWAVIPLSVPFVWLLFPFSRRFRVYDHTVFVTYSLCFMMLLLTGGTLVGLVSESVASLAWFVPPVHMYRQLRRTYRVSGWGAVWRTFALTIFAFIAIGLFAGLLVTIGAFD